MLKSPPPPEDIHGDAEKYRSYREAWTRIKQASEAGFYLEAVTIEESIISERISAHLTANGTRLKGHPAFANLIRALERWAKDNRQYPIRQGRFSDLTQALDDWRKQRNAAVHTIVQPDPQVEHHIEQFVQAAEKAAAEGQALARAVDNWYRKTNHKR